MSATNHINVTVKNEDGSEIFFKIEFEKNTELSDLMITKHSDRSLSLDFQFNGKRVQESEQTPNEIQMEGVDETQVIPVMEQKDYNNDINLKVNGMISVDKRDSYMKIDKSSQLRKLMTKYCEQQSQDPNGSLRFMYKGKVLRGEQTLRQNGDEIFALPYVAFS